MCFFSEVEKLSNCLIKKQEPLCKHSTFGVGGNAKYFVFADTLFFVNRVINLATEFNIDYKIIGNGSNLLFSDKGFNGVIICAKNIKDLFYLGGDKVKAMSGVNINALVDFCINQGLQGLENFYGIPATIGGLVTMNGGAFNAQISNFIEEVECIESGKIKKYFNHECKFGYRKSIFQNKKIFISSVTLKLKKGDKKLSTLSKNNFFDIRKLIQPLGKSFGSTFRNTKNYSDGYLIETAGLKGKSIGGAVVSDKHANFIINYKNATAEDAYNLIALIKKEVYKKHKILLKEEVEYVGEFDDINGRLSHSHKI